MASKSILIVDDEPKVGYLLKKSLEASGQGYAVSQVYSAEDALSALARRPYDLVVTDLRMPGMNGLDLLSRVKRDNPDTRTILITAYGSDDVVAATRRLQATRYFAKPFRIEEFLQAVEDALNSPAPSATAAVVSGKHVEWLVQRLHDLRFEVGAQSVVLADMSGRLLAEIGAIDGLEPGSLAAMVGGSLAASFEIAQRLREERAFNLVYHEGVRFDIYAVNIDEELFIALVFDRRQGASRIGMVWLYTKRAIQELQNWGTAVE